MSSGDLAVTDRRRRAEPFGSGWKGLYRGEGHALHHYTEPDTVAVTAQSVQAVALVMSRPVSGLR